MKKIVFVAVLISSVLGVGRAEAQISLLRTFEGNVSPTHTTHILPGDFNGYYTSGSTSSPIKIYNEDFSVRASVSVSVPSGYQINGVSCVSEKVFNSDDNIELIVQFTNSANAGTNTQAIMRLYNENGSMLKDFGNAYLFNPFLQVVSNGDYRLLVLRYDYNSGNPKINTDIYSLPGKQETTSALPPLIKEETELSYKLRMGETATMKIYNIKGQLIETKKIDYTFNKLLLNTAKYPRGTYIYKINDIEVQKFVLK